MKTARHVIWWLGGAPADILDKCQPCLQRRHTARGIVFALNFLFLVCVWVDVGVHYFGWIGVVCPGLIIPSILVLGLGRLIAMYRPVGAGWPPMQGVPAQRPSRLFWVPRVVIAVVLSTATTLSLMMIESRDLIHKSAVEVAKVANSGLEDEKTREINITYDALEATHKARADDLTKERAKLSDTLAAAMASINDAITHREQAVREQSFEKGGLDSRLSGPGIKFHAWQDLGTHYKEVVVRASEQQRDAAHSIGRLNDALDAERIEIGKLEAQRQQALSGISQAVRGEIGYVGETQGLFSDATLFLGLYGRRDVGPGMWGVSIVVVLFLFLVELSDLIAVSLSPCEIVPLGEWASVRLATAKLVSSAEIELARSGGSRPPPWIERQYSGIDGDSNLEGEFESDSGRP